LIAAKRVIVRPGEELADAKILIEHGRILAVGKDVTAPEDAKLVEAGVVCAAFLDPWSSVALDAGSLTEMASNPGTRSTDAWNPFDTSESRTEALSAGVTAARVQAAPSAAVAGIGAIVRLEQKGESSILSPDACIAATIGVTRGGRLADIFDRVGEVDRLVSQLSRAQAYDASWRKWRADLAKWNEAIAKKTKELEDGFKKAKKKRDKEVKEAEEKGKTFKDKRYKEDKKPKKPKFDPDVEALARAVNGELPLVVEVHRAEEIRALLAKTKGFPLLRLVIAGGTEAAPLAGDLAARHVPVICWPAPMGEGGKDEWAEHDLGLAAELEAGGVEVLIGSGGGAYPRELRVLAALAVGHGLDRDAALAAITTRPAAVFDLAASRGSVTRGQDAELVLLNGDPLDTTSRVVGVVTAGRLVQ